jgi:AcrR family transcriptional regulator
VNRVELAGSTKVQERILTAATQLFARLGYRGTTTRQIASEAGVNEVTIYRRYGSKRKLYCAVIESELDSIDLRKDILALLGSASTRADAISHALELIRTTLEPKRDLLRLMQFGALEMTQDVKPILRSYLVELTELVASHLQPWMAAADLECFRLRDVVLLVAAVVAFESSLQGVLPERVSLVASLRGNWVT